MKTAARHSAFTLVELLVVIAIVGLLAAITLPTLINFRGADATLAATRQLQDDVGRARQLAISQRTTVYMVFCPSNFWNDPNFNRLNLSEKAKAAKLYDKQLTGYTFVTLRGVGDQPGQPVARYLAPWRTLPDGAFIPEFKFAPRSFVTTIYDPPLPAAPTDRFFNVKGFSVTNTIPFPSADAALIPGAKPYVPLPYIAFNHLGQLESGEDEFIPLARGSVQHGRDADKKPTQNVPSLLEQPLGNSTNAFSLIHIDWLTGRARLERQEFK